MRVEYHDMLYRRTRSGSGTPHIVLRLPAYKEQARLSLAYNIAYLLNRARSIQRGYDRTIGKGCKIYHKTA